MNITLILAAHPNDPLRKKDPFMPLSLPILASLAPEHHYTFIDMLWDTEQIDYSTTDEIIGISLRQSAESTAYAIADEFLKKGKTVILGGPQASAVPHRAIAHASSVVVGEAEDTWPMLLKDYQNKQLKDFYVCSPKPFDAQGHTFYQQEDFPTLASLPLPNRSLFKRKYTFDLTFASRGCPIGCDFCLVSDIYGKKSRFKPIDDVIKDINQFRGFFYLLDETVFGRSNSYSYYEQLYNKLSKNKKKRYWTGQANLDAAANEQGQNVIKKAAKAGLVYAAIGIESVNKKTLEDSGAYAKMGIKNGDSYLEKMKEQIAFIQAQGIIVSGWFAIGYETDSLQTYYDSLAFCIETNILPVFTPVRALSGSRLWDKINAEGRLQDITTNVSNIKHPLLTNADITKGLQHVEEIGFSRKNNLKRLKFYFNIFRKSESSVHNVIYKTIFAHITQKRMAEIVKAETKRLTNNFG